MAIISGKDTNWTAKRGIVQSGLVLNLDAAVRSSYPEIGTSWYDLASNNNGTLTNGPSYDQINGRYFLCDGINDYILANNTSLNSVFSSTSVSHFIWVYPISAGQIVTELGQTTLNSSWHDSNIEISSNGAFSFSTWHNALTSKVVSSNKSFNQWYYVGFSYDGTTLTAYINGLSIGTTTFSRQAPYYNGFNTYYALCATDTTNMGTQGYAGARISNFSVYNRALSATEISQNYNATRKRFGL